MLLVNCHGEQPRAGHVSLPRDHHERTTDRSRQCAQSMGAISPKCAQRPTATTTSMWPTTPVRSRRTDVRPVGMGLRPTNGLIEVVQ
jgi:hypothetical protein